MKPRQLDVELNTMILAASHSGRPHIVEKLKDLRTAMLGFTKQEEERGAKETALLAEVERVDRAAARIALETERLKRLRDEAMMMVRRVEPAALETSQDDLELLHLSKDLKEARDVIFTENYRDSDHSEDSEPRLTKMFPKSSQLRRHGSYGSLVQASPASRVMMPPAMPLIQNWGDPHHPHHQYPPQFQPYPYMYGAPLLPPPHMGPPVYYGHHEDCNSQLNRTGGRRREARHEADMSTDEGENTSNDAGDISSSDASGSGRRRKIKTSGSPKPKLIPSHGNKAVSQPRKSDKFKPLRTSTPERVEKNSEENIETKKLEDCEQTKQNLPPVPTETVISVPEVAEKVTGVDVKDKAEESEDNLILDSDNSPEDLKLYSPESESSPKEEVKVEKEEMVEVVEKKPSVSRERKVGVKRVEETDAYQQMLMGGVKKPPPSQILNTDDSTSDDIEAQLAVVSRPRNTFKAVTNSVHNLDDESLSEPEPAPVETLKLRGLGGHPVPLNLGLVGGRLGHPAAHRVGMMALGNNNNNQQVHGGNTGANLSGPENDDDDDDFWS